MSCEKEDIGEVDGASTHSFCIHCLLELNFSFVLRVFGFGLHVRAGASTL
jgi:hypothetical protein